VLRLPLLIASKKLILLALLFCHILGKNQAVKNRQKYSLINREVQRPAMPNKHAHNWHSNTPLVEDPGSQLMSSDGQAQLMPPDGHINHPIDGSTLRRD